MRQMLVAAVVIGGCYVSSPPPPASAPPPPPRQYPKDSASPPLVIEAPRPTLAVAGSDNSLVLLGSEHRSSGRSDHHEHSRICVQDQARISVDGSTELVLSSDETTVIGGRGIGPSGTTRAKIRIVALGKPEIFVLFDNANAPVDAVIEAPRSTVHVGLTGKTGLHISGKTASMHYYAGWGLPDTFPDCNASIDRVR